MKRYKTNIIILILVSFLVLFLVLKDDFKSVVGALASVNFLLLIVAIFVVMLSWVFASLCLHTLAKHIEKDFRIRDYFKSIIITNFFSAITPYAVGGQPFQVYYLSKKGMKLSNATNIIIEFFKIHQITLVLLGFMAVILNAKFNYFPDDNILQNIVLLGFILNGAIAVLLILISKYKTIGERIAKKIVKLLHKIKIIKKEDMFLQKIDNYIYESNISSIYYDKHKKDLFIAGIYNFISLCLIYATPLFVAYSLGHFHSLNIIDAIAGSAYVMIIGAIVPVPGGTGGLEFGFAHFFGFFLTGSTLMAALLIWRFITYYLGILVGGIIMLFLANRKKSFLDSNQKEAAK